MIHSAIQLKAKVRNLSGGDSVKAQTLIRNYMMERFLERCSVSKYRDCFILKGGMFVASYVGIDTRATMDIDATVQSLPLTLDNVSNVIREIISISIEDGITFEITSAKEIMEEHEYPGLRFMLDGFLDHMRQPIKIDISAGDIVTPRAIEYQYTLMFEDRTISVLAYNIETVLAEKMETILSRAEANTRMRDFYDIYVLLKEKRGSIHENVLREAFSETCRRRNSSNIIAATESILESVGISTTMRKQWNNYCTSSFYVGNLRWQEAVNSVYDLAQMLNIL